LLNLLLYYVIGKTTILTTSKKVSKFLCLNSIIPTKITQSWNIIGDKKYGEAKLKEIDEYMLKNKLRYSLKEPGRYPPILESIQDDNNKLPSIKKVFDKVVPISGNALVTTTTTSSTTSSSVIRTQTNKTTAVTTTPHPSPDVVVAIEKVVKRKKSVLDLTADDLKGKRYDYDDNLDYRYC